MPGCQPASDHHRLIKIKVVAGGLPDAGGKGGSISGNVKDNGDKWLNCNTHPLHFYHAQGRKKATDPSGQILHLSGQELHNGEREG